MRALVALTMVVMVTMGAARLGEESEYSASVAVGECLKPFNVDPESAREGVLWVTRFVDLTQNQIEQIQTQADICIERNEKSGIIGWRGRLFK